ncbi:EF-hand calcium-binding domain-containing protein 4B [Latimeria chalumnae]|uniref:EF-hand calcium-binding domain-containing protein 4B n=1 Tax=Latimeria chalumnae TaxID=7897 RepID=UPI00313DFE91
MEALKLSHVARARKTDRTKEESRFPALMAETEWNGAEKQNSAQLTMLEKAHEFFQICDRENKGFITKRDMQRLHGELPLSPDELESVFDSLDADGNGFLTLEEFTSGFSQFVFGQKIVVNEMAEERAEQIQNETLYQSQWEEKLQQVEDDGEHHFYMMMESLGANNILEDHSDIRNLWLQLRKEEPHLLANFEEFLAKVFYQIQEANEEKKEMEFALKKKVATHDEEIQNLYEEMEQQIKTEKERILLQDSEKFQSRSQELEFKLKSKEQQLEQLVQKQKRLEKQCMELHSDQHETKVQNEKLKQTNQELEEELELTSQELLLSQQQLQMLQEEASRLHEEREMELYRITEGLQREKASLLKQLDLLREMNKHLRDERDMCLQPKNNAVTASWKKRTGSIVGKYTDRRTSIKSQSSEEEDVTTGRKINSASLNGLCPVSNDSEYESKLRKRQHLQRIISIEEDHLPQFLDLEYETNLTEWAEEEERVITEENNNKEEEKNSTNGTPSSPRGQPVGKETVSSVESSNTCLDRLFKIVFVGNSSVGKTSFLRRFCEDCFYPGTAATVGIDYSVKTVTVENCQVALQLWDTAGQERYRSITKQFFRKADGVIIMYDITVECTFTAIRQWLTNVQEAAGETIPVLLLGNKTDKEKEREVPTKFGERIAKDYNLIFYECSAFSGHNTKDSMLHLAKILKDQEDKQKENTIQLVQDSPKKKTCCSRQ